MSSKKQRLYAKTYQSVPKNPMTQKQRNMAEANRGAALQRLRQRGMTIYKSPVYVNRSKPDELKGVDGQIDQNPVLSTTSTNASSFVLNLVQQGNGSWNRVGRKISLKSLRMKGIANFTNMNTTNLDQNTLRMVVVWDKQPSSGTVPTFDTIFGGTDQNGTETTVFLSNLRYDNTARFSVLKDYVIDTDNNFPVSNTTTQIYQKSFDEFIPLRGLETLFSGQSNPMTIADISSGALYVFFRAEVNNASTFVSIQSSAFRLRYYD